MTTTPAPETRDAYGRTAPRLVTAVLRFHDGPGLEQLAADAWAFELTYYFTRGVGERPRVEYEDGVYTLTILPTAEAGGFQRSPAGVPVSRPTAPGRTRSV